MFSPPLKKSIVFLKYALKMDLVKGAWFDLYGEWFDLYDYPLCRTELREHTNKSVSDLHLNDDAVQILTDEKYNPRLLSELLSHENFHKFMTDLEIYIDGFNDNGIQIANTFLDVMRYKLNELGADSTDAYTKIFDTSHIETEQYYINILLEDLKPIASDLRNTHMKDSNTDSDIFF